MIRVEMHGRLGNQMFQYATARALQNKVNQEMVFSFRSVLNEKDKEGSVGWGDDLQYLNVKPYKIYKGKKSLLFFKSSIKQIVLTLMYYLSYKPLLLNDPYNFQQVYEKQLKWAKLLNRYGIWWFKFGYYPFESKYKGNYLLNGGFEDSRYFNKIRNELILEFTPKKALTSSQLDLITVLKESNSVCLSIRHFVLKDKERNKVFNVCDINYYKKAISVICKKVKNPVFYICSDDLEWVKNKFDFLNDYNVIFEDSKERPEIKLYIMTQCHHFIVSNSTFSWWAQYLGNYSNKIVVGPSKWYNIPNYVSPLVEKSWIKI
ncbi:MAG: alpha-1,2-fucosyltransferase [Clostridium sp.]|jgi:hypothetical protein|uniref:alpha-1,2-fucosyltransferase n=1 Tax=Clostridium sp. TaxID=1506 RepID=UPI002A7490FE|nr:alpha-1,2-fucosyltransferase [Clostridium sp.]MDY2630917.1 alpha-1,2-fucosyltransferase [Clostridium sp.]MDY2787489.1 alpha-1,2-fucosyltransferase [Lactobacillus amylovorus]